MSSRTSEQERLAQNPEKWPSWPRGTACKVFMGAGWASGTWQGLEGVRGAVWLGKAQRTVYVADARNVRRA